MEYPSSSNTSSQSLCTRCEILYNQADIFSPTEAIPETGQNLLSLGKPTARNGCTLCKFFLDLTPGYIRKHQQHVRLFNRIRQTHLTLRNPAPTNFPPTQFMSVLRENSRLEYDYLLEDEITQAGVVVYIPANESVKPAISSIDASAANFALLSSLIENCNAKHTLCNQIEHRYSLPYIYLINCIDEVLVQAHPSQSYLALSYVWGPQNNSAAPKDATHWNGKPDTTFSFSKAPLTIQDAIRAVRKLGRKYLWVDKYCINQSGDQEKLMMLRNMDEIYENAEATIVALYGDDDRAGLPGVSIIPRTPQPQFQTAHGGRLISSCSPISVLIEKSKWATRGWTYQEARLSRRCLFFTASQVYHVCLQTTASESLPSSPTSNLLSSLLNATHLGPALFTPRTTRLQDFALDRQVFTQRTLTYEADILDAFRGILNRAKVLSFWGVPIAAPKASVLDPRTGFALGLLWTRKPRRAISSHLKSPADPPRLRRPGFPTWSWTSVTGEIFNEDAPPTPNTNSNIHPQASRVESIFASYLVGEDSSTVSKIDRAAFLQFSVQVEGGDWKPMHEAIQTQCTNTLREESTLLLVEGDLVKVQRVPASDQYRIHDRPELPSLVFDAAFDLDCDMARAASPTHAQNQNQNTTTTTTSSALNDIQDALILVEWNDMQRSTKRRFVLMLLVWNSDGRAERRGLLSEYRREYDVVHLDSVERRRRTFVLA